MNSFPNRETKIGQKIDKYLRGEINMEKEEIHKLFSQNRQEFRLTILYLMNLGVNVIVDRYSHSGFAYSIASGLKFDWCKENEKDLPCPDVVFFLDVDPWDATKRFGYGEERYEKLEFQKSVASAYKSLMDDSWVILDAKKEVSEIHEMICSVVSRFSREKQIQFFFIFSSAFFLVFILKAEESVRES